MLCPAFCFASLSSSLFQWMLRLFSASMPGNFEWFATKLFVWRLFARNKLWQNCSKISQGSGNDILCRIVPPAAWIFNLHHFFYICLVFFGSVQIFNLHHLQTSINVERQAKNCDIHLTIFLYFDILPGQTQVKHILNSSSLAHAPGILRFSPGPAVAASWVKSLSFPGYIYNHLLCWEVHDFDPRISSGTRDVCNHEATTHDYLFQHQTSFKQRYVWSTSCLLNGTWSINDTTKHIVAPNHIPFVVIHDIPYVTIKYPMIYLY